MAEVDQKLTIKERIDILLGTVQKGDRVLVCTHDNPDPDSIASAFALGRLLEAKKKATFTLTYGGVLGRAENKAMVKLLDIPLVPIRRIDISQFDVVGLVDTQPEVGNHSLPHEQIADKRLICIDHHPARERSAEADYADVGGDFGATCTLLTHYLHEAGVVPDRNLATALFYGVKSDTRDLGREVSQDDVWAYSHLVSLTDMPLVSAIEHPRLPRGYFTVLMRAIRNSKVFGGNLVACDLGELYAPDLVAETADRLASAEKIRWAIVVGGYQGDIYASLRVNDRRFSAGKLARQVIKDFPDGSAGGHGSMAGARVPYSEKVGDEAAKRTRERRRLLRALNAAAGIEPEDKGDAFAPSELELDARAETKRTAVTTSKTSPPAKIEPEAANGKNGKRTAAVPTEGGDSASGKPA